MGIKNAREPEESDMSSDLNRDALKGSSRNGLAAACWGTE